MRLILVAAFICIGSFVLHAQSPRERDSLFKVLNSTKADTSKIKLYLLVGNTFESNDEDSAKFYFKKAGDLSKKINYSWGYYKYLTSYGNALLAHGKNDSSIYYQQKAYETATQMKDSLNMGISLFNIGINYTQKADYTKAIEYSLQGKQIIEKAGDKRLEMQMNDALQVLYNARTEYKKAVVFGEMALAQARELKDMDMVAQCLINLSMNYVELKEIQKCNTSLEEALKISEELGNLRFKATTLENLAAIGLKERDIPRTIKYANQGLDLYKQVGSLDGQATALRALATCYLQLKDNKKAMEYAQQSLDIDRKNNYKREEASILRLMSYIAYAKGDARDGLDYDDKSNAMLEDLMKDILSQQSSDLEKKYETEKKEAQIKELQAEKKVHELTIRQKNILNYSLVAGACILLIISLLSYRTYKQKQKLQQQRISELETEKQLTATEAVLKGEEQERTRLAKDLHDGLGGMLSGIKFSMNTMKGNLIMTPENQQAFERSMDMLDSSIREMRRVAHNMMPETLVKFGLDTALNDFCNDINQSGALRVSYQSIGMEGADIDQTTAVTLYRIVQELVNNSIKHAAAKSVIVQLTKTNGDLSVTVEDDGKGFDTNILKQSKGIGWSNIQNRVEFLKGRIDVNAAPGKGTSVLIEINA
ncbi:MAG: sensor histidine kinase [Chitinophagaceae bacterium]